MTIDTIEQFVQQYPAESLRVLERIDIARIAQLLDRGSLSEVGSILWHEFDTAKHEAQTTALRPTEEITADPVMLKPQAD